MAKRKNRNRQQEKKINLLRNEQIRVPEVRITGDNVEQGIYPINEAMSMAEAQELDLVMIAPKAVPPVCKIVDYGKLIYEMTKNKPKPQKTVTKEIRFTPNTDKNDFDFKVKHARNFLGKGFRVKAYVFFRGRENIYEDRGLKLLLQMAETLEDIGTAEAMPKKDGRYMTMYLKPKK